LLDLEEAVEHKYPISENELDLVLQGQETNRDIRKILWKLITYCKILKIP